MQKFESIILDARWFSEGEFWNLSATGYNGEDDPEYIEIEPQWLLGETTTDEVKETLEFMAPAFLEDNLLPVIASEVSIHFEGSEYKHLIN